VRRLFAHHEYLCTRQGYWIGLPLATVMGSGDDLVDDPRVGWMSYVDSGS